MSDQPESNSNAAVSSGDISGKIEDFYRDKWNRKKGFWRDTYEEHSVLKRDVLDKRHNFIKEHSEGCERVLDIGCGVADLLRDVGRKEIRIGIDMSATNVARSRENMKGEDGAFFLMADGCFLPFPDGSFDAVYFADVIEHIPNYQEVVDEIFRVLRPGGKCICVTPNGKVIDFFEGLDKIAFGLYFAIRRSRKQGKQKEVFYEEFIPPAALRRSFEKAGFKVQRHSMEIFYPGTGGTGLVPLIVYRLYHISRPLFRVALFMLRCLAALLEPLKVFNFKQFIIAEKAPMK